MPKPTIFESGGWNPFDSPNGKTEMSPNYPMSDFYGDPLSLINGEPGEGSLDEVIVQATKDLYEDWDEARATHLAESNLVWDRYLNRWDFSKKADWQSQRKIPKVTMAVEKLTAAMSRLLTMSKKWFSVKARSPQMEKWVGFVFDLVDFQLANDKVGFFKLLRRAIKIGLLSHIMATSVSWESNGYANPEYIPAEDVESPSEDNTFRNTLFGTASTRSSSSPEIPDAEPSFLRLENINPHKLLLDPTGRKRGYIIERSYTIAEFRMEAEERLWDLGMVEAAIEKSFADCEMNAEDADKRDMPTQSMSDQILIWELWLEYLPTKKGDSAIDMRNFFYVMAQKEFVVQRPTPNPFWHGDPPLVTCGMIDVPFSVYHMSPMGLSVECIELWVDFINLTVDYHQKFMNGIQEINMTVLHPDEEKDGLLDLYPGKTVMKSGPEPLMMQMLMPEPPQSLGGFMQMLHSEIGEGTAMAGLNDGPLPRRKMTASEGSARSADAGVLLDSFFENIQDDWILPIIRMAYLNTLQFMPQSEWNEFVSQRQDKYKDLAAEFEELKKMEPIQRFELLGSKIRFECRVFSAIFDRQQELEKGTFFLGIVGRTPMAQVHVKWGNFLGKMVENLGYAKEDMISDEPLVPYSEVFGGKNAQTGQPLAGSMGSDGGEAIPQEAPPSNMMEGQASGGLGTGENDSSLMNLFGAGSA